MQRMTNPFYRLLESDKLFSLPIQRRNRMVYQLRIPYGKGFIKAFIRLKNC